MNALKRTISVVLLTATLAGTLAMGASATATTQTTEDINIAPSGNQNMITGTIGDWFQDTFNLLRDYKNEGALNFDTVKNPEFGYTTVTHNKINLRTGPGTDHQVVSLANKDDAAFVLGKTDKWYKVMCNGRVCYIHSSFLDVAPTSDEKQVSSKDSQSSIKTRTVDIPSSTEVCTKSPIASTIITNAMEHIGTPYVYGGSKPGGFDCSGFTQYIFAQSDISIPRTTTDQYKRGTYVEKSELQPGDLVFFANTYRKGISHVGIYIGDGNIIHASSSKGITIASLSSNYYRSHYYGSRRIIQ